MERWRTMKKVLVFLLSFAQACPAQYTSYVRSNIPKHAVVIFSATLSSNANSTGLVATPARKQLGNFGVSCSGGVIQPSGIGLGWWGASALAAPVQQAVPVGQLYATTAAKTAAEAAGCAVQGVLAATASGTGIAVPTNGQGAGGTDSATAETNTYGATTDDAICTGDPHHADPTMIVGLPAPGCTSASSAVFSEATAAGFGNADMLWPTLYASNSTTLDQACCYLRSIYFELVTSVASLHDFEIDVNINSSPTAYTGGTGGYCGWGTHWGATPQMFQYCPQDCTGWKTFKGKDCAGVNPDLTQYPLTSGHWYHLLQYGHRDTVCTAANGSNCYWYDMMTIYDVTAGTTPVTYHLVDAATGNPAGGIPVNHSTWTSGEDSQEQLDSILGSNTITVHVQSDTTVVYNLQ
jgi:hypothetical protein